MFLPKHLNQLRRESLCYNKRIFTKEERMKILLTNDDGYRAPGIAALARELEKKS